MKHCDDFQKRKILYSRIECAEMLGVSERTVARANKNGELGFVRIGDRVLISEEHVRDFILRHERDVRRSR